MTPSNRGALADYTTPPAAIDLLKEQCNRYANGFCHTRKCLVRGGYKSGDPRDDHEATCEFREAVTAIVQRDSLLVALRSAEEALTDDVDIQDNDSVKLAQAIIEAALVATEQ